MMMKCGDGADAWAQRRWRSRPQMQPLVRSTACDALQHIREERDLLILNLERVCVDRDLLVLDLYLPGNASHIFLALLI